MKPPEQPDPETNPMPPTSSNMVPDASDSGVFAKQFTDTPAPSPGQAASNSPGRSGGDKLPSAFTLFQPSSRLVRNNLFSFMMLVLLPTFYILVIELVLNPKLARQQAGLWIGFGGIFLLYNLLTFAAKPLLELRTVQGHHLEFMQAVRGGYHYFWRLLGLYLVVGLLLVVGSLLFIVPGVIVYRRYALASYFLVDNDLGIGEAMRRSAATTKGHGMAIYGIAGVELLLSVPSWIPIIGSFVAVSVGMLYSCSSALRYEQFKAFNASSPVEQPSTNPVG